MHGFVLAFVSGLYRFISRAKLWDMRRRLGRINGEDAVPDNVQEALDLMARVAQEGSQRWCAPTYLDTRAPSGRISPDWYKSEQKPAKPALRKRKLSPPKSRILACILARNESARIEYALKSLVG